MPMPHDDERNDIQPPAPLPAPSPWKSQSWGIGRAETPDPKGGTLRALDALGQKVPMDEAAKGWSIAAPGQRPQERAVDWDPDPNKWGDESKKRYRELVEQSTLGTGYEATWDENTGWLKSLDKYSDGGGKRLKGGHGWTEWLWGKQDKHTPHVHARVRAEAERRLRQFMETGEGRPVSHRDLMAYVEDLEGRLSRESLRARGDAIRAKGLGKEEEAAALEAERASAMKEYEEFAPFKAHLDRQEKRVPGLRNVFEALGYDNNRGAENRAVPDNRLLDEKEVEEAAKRPEFARYRGLKGLGTGALDRYIAGNGRNILPIFGALLPDADKERMTETLERVNAPGRYYALGTTDPDYQADRAWLIQMQNRLMVQAAAAGWAYKGSGIALDSLKFAADLKAATALLGSAGGAAAKGLGALAARGGAAGATAAKVLQAGRAAGNAWQGVQAAAEGIGAGGSKLGTAARWAAKGGIGIAEAAGTGLAQTAFMPDEVIQNHQRGNEWSPTFYRDSGGELAVGASQGNEGWAESFLAAAQEAFTENLGGKLFDPALKQATAGMRAAYVRGLRALGRNPKAAAKAGMIPTTGQILKDWAKTYGRDSIAGEELEEVAGRLLDVMSGRDEHSPEDSVGDRLLAVFRLDTVMGDIIGFGLSGGPLAAGGVVEAGRVHALQGQRHFEETQSKIVGKMQLAGVDPSFIAPFAEARDIGEWDRAAYELGASLDGLAQVAGALAEDATMTGGERRKVTEGMLPEYTRWQLQREDFVRRLEAAKEDAGTVRRFQNAQSEEDLRGAWDWYMNRYEKETMPGTLKDERIADAEAKGLSLSPEGREKLAAATTRKEFEDALREAWRGNGAGAAQAAAETPQGAESAPAAAPSAEETGVAAIQGDPEAQARVDETLARVADGDVSALDDEQVMDDEDSGYDIAADFAKMEAEEAAAAAAAANQPAVEPPAATGEGGEALASQVPGMPVPDASSISPEGRAALEAQAQERLGEAARQEEPTAAPGAETEKPSEEAPAAPAAEGETAAQETRQEEPEEAKARREMEEVLGKGKVGVIGTDLQEGDSVTLADGTIAYVGKTDGWGKVSLYRKGWTFSNWIAGDQTIRVDKVMRGGKDATKELAERTAARESMRESAGETSGAESWKKSAEAFRRFGERLAARFPKVGDGKGGAVAPRVVVEGTEGAVIPESVRKAYEKSQRERREAAGEGKAAGFAGRGLYDPESSTIYLFEGADETTLQHETGHLIRDWARKGSPQLAAQFEKLMREMPGEVVAWARANYAGASEDLIHEEAVAEWLGRNARSVMQEILRTEADRSWWGRVKKAVARECRTVLNRLTGKPAAAGGTVKIDIAALSDGDVVRRLFAELLGEEGGAVEFGAERETNPAVSDYDAREGTEIAAMLADIRDGSIGSKHRHYRIANSSDLLKAHGVTGERFTIRSGVITRHGKKKGHHLTEEEWLGVANALPNPFAITRHPSGAKNYRLWLRTTIQGKTAIVGVTVKSAGKGLEVNAIDTVFGRDGAKIARSNVVYLADDLTDEQKNVLSEDMIAPAEGQSVPMDQNRPIYPANAEATSTMPQASLDARGKEEKSGAKKAKAQAGASVPETGQDASAESLKAAIDAVRSARLAKEDDAALQDLQKERDALRRKTDNEEFYREPKDGELGEGSKILYTKRVEGQTPWQQKATVSRVEGDTVVFKNWKGDEVSIPRSDVVSVLDKEELDEAKRQLEGLNAKVREAESVHDAAIAEADKHLDEARAPAAPLPVPKAARERKPTAAETAVAKAAADLADANKAVRDAEDAEREALRDAWTGVKPEEALSVIKRGDRIRFEGTDRYGRGTTENEGIVVAVQRENDRQKFGAFTVRTSDGKKKTVLSHGVRWVFQPGKASEKANGAVAAAKKRAEAAARRLRAASEKLPPLKPNAKATKVAEKFCYKDTDKKRPLLAKPWHDKENRVVVATDGAFLIATRHGFDPDWKSELEGSFPNWRQVIPADKDYQTRVQVNPDALAKAIRAAVRLARATGTLDKYNGGVKVAVRAKNGVVILDGEKLIPVLEAMGANGINEIRLSDKEPDMHPIMAKNAETVVVLMPVRHGDMETVGRRGEAGFIVDSVTGRLIKAPERNDSTPGRQSDDLSKAEKRLAAEDEIDGRMLREADARAALGLRDGQEKNGGGLAFSKGGVGSHGTLRDWSKAHVPEMRKELVRRGLSSLGSPSKLRERLTADDAAVVESEESGALNVVKGDIAFSNGGAPRDVPGQQFLFGEGGEAKVAVQLGGADVQAEIDRNVEEILSGLKEARGKTTAEITALFDNTQKIIGRLPDDLALPRRLDASRRVVKGAQAYILDHLLNKPGHERECTAEDARRIIGLIDPHNEMRIIPQRGSSSLAFIAPSPGGGWDCIVIAPRRGEFYVFKTLFSQTKKPYQEKLRIRYEPGSSVRNEAVGSLPRGHLASVRDVDRTEESTARRPENVKGEDAPPDLAFSKGGAGKEKEGDVEPFRPFELNDDAEVADDPELHKMGSWFKAKPHKAGEGRWDIRDGEGRILAANLATRRMASWIIAEQRAELGLAMSVLRKQKKANLAKILAARGRFIKMYMGAAASVYKAAKDKVAKEREKQDVLSQERRNAVEAYRQLLAEMGIPKEVWSEAVVQFKRFAAAKTIRNIAVVRDQATKYADTVMTTAAVRVLEREVDEALRKAEGRDTDSGVKLRAVTGIRELRAAYESKDSEKDIAARKDDIRSNIQAVELALDCCMDFAGFAASNPGAAAKIEARWGIDLANLPKQDYNESREMLDAIRLRLYAERDAWENFPALKHRHGWKKDEIRSGADLKHWIDALEFLKRTTKEAVEKRKANEAAKRDYADSTRAGLISDLGFRNGVEHAKTMEDAREVRKAHRILDWWNWFLLGHASGPTLADMMVRAAGPAKTDVKRPGFREGTMDRIVDSFVRCHWKEFKMNEMRERDLGSLLSRYAGLGGKDSAGRVEALANLRKEREADDSFTKVNYARDKHGNLVMGRGKHIRNSLAELLPIPLIALQGEDEAGMPYEEWLEKYYDNPAAVKKAKKEGIVFKAGIFESLMKSGWAPVVVEQIRKLHEEAGVGQLAEALSQYMNKNFPRLNLMVAWMYGGALKKVAHYCPLRRDYVSADIGRGDDGLGAWMRLMAAFLKERRDNRLEIVPYDLIDAAQKQVEQQNHLLAYYETVDHVRRVFGHRDMQIALTHALGDKAREVVNGYLAHVAHGGRKPTGKPDGSRVLDHLRRSFGIAAITRPATAIRQMTSAPVMAAFLPEDADVGLYLLKSSRMIVDPVTRQRFYKEMKEHIPDLRWRGRGNIDPITADLLHARKGKLGRLVKTVADKGGKMTRWGDEWAVVTGSYGMFSAWRDHFLKQGMSKEAAEKQAWFKTSFAYNATQQSNMAEFLSYFAQAGGFMGWTMMFMSSPAAVSNTVASHLRGLALKRGSPKHHFAALFSVFLAQRLFNLFKGEIFSWGAGDGDDDEFWRRFLRNLSREAAAFGDAAIGSTINGYMYGDDIWELAKEVFRHRVLGQGGRPWTLTAEDIMPAVGTVNDFAALLFGDLSSPANQRRLASFAGTVTGTPVPGAHAVVSGVYDAIANPEDDLTIWQRFGRALGYSRRQVGAK